MGVNMRKVGGNYKGNTTKLKVNKETLTLLLAVNKQQANVIHDLEEEIATLEEQRDYAIYKKESIYDKLDEHPLRSAFRLLTGRLI